MPVNEEVTVRFSEYCKHLSTFLDLKMENLKAVRQNMCKPTLPQRSQFDSFDTPNKDMHELIERPECFSV